MKRRSFTTGLLLAILILAGACASSKQGVEEVASSPPVYDSIIGTWTFSSYPGTNCSGEMTFRSDRTFSQLLRCSAGSEPFEINTSGEWSMTYGRLVQVTLETDTPDVFQVGQASNWQVESVTENQATLVDDHGLRYVMQRKSQ